MLLVQRVYGDPQMIGAGPDQAVEKIHTVAEMEPAIPLPGCLRHRSRDQHHWKRHQVSFHLRLFLAITAAGNQFDRRDHRNSQFLWCRIYPGLGSLISTKIIYQNRCIHKLKGFSHNASCQPVGEVFRQRQPGLGLQDNRPTFQNRSAFLMLFFEQPAFLPGIAKIRESAPLQPDDPAARPQFVARLVLSRQE